MTISFGGVHQVVLLGAEFFINIDPIWSFPQSLVGLLRTKLIRHLFKKYGLTMHGSVQILRRSNFGISLICILRKEIWNIWLFAECLIYCTGLQSIESHIKLYSLTFTVRAEGSLLCCEVVGAILTCVYNKMLHCRRTETKTGNDVNADAVLVFGVVIDLTGEWLYVSWFGTNKTCRTIKIAQWLSCPLAVQRSRHCGVCLLLCLVDLWTYRKLWKSCDDEKTFHNTQRY